MAKRNHMSTTQKFIASTGITAGILACFCAFASSIHLVLVFHVFPSGNKFRLNVCVIDIHTF